MINTLGYCYFAILGESGFWSKVVSSLKTTKLHQAKRGLMVIFVRYISAFDYYVGIYWFCAYTFENQMLQYLQKRLSRMLDISNCDVIYYFIYVTCSHYVGKAISPLFAWPTSLVFYRNKRNWYRKKISDILNLIR